jgi:GDPmannose 4,6-dehydratase
MKRGQKAKVHTPRAKKRALITGITGQDGSYLAELLLDKGYEVHGLVRRSSRDPLIRNASHKHRITIHYGDLRDLGALERAIVASDPHEIYNLAAQSDVGVSFKVPEETYEIDYAGVGRLIDAALRHNPKIRIYQASTSEMFGSTPPPQSEKSPFNPVSPYGLAKKKAHEDYVKGYREKYGAYIVSGILFNHESPRRGEHFVTRKITLSLAKIKAGQQEVLTLGNLDAKRDWGHALDYVEAMWLMLQQPSPRDYVIATGVQHSVREFVDAAAKTIGLPLRFSGKGKKEVGKDVKGKVRVAVNPAYYRPNEVHSLKGDPRRAKKDLKWQPRYAFKDLVRIMALADLQAVEEGLKVS